MNKTAQDVIKLVIITIIITLLLLLLLLLWQRSQVQTKIMAVLC